MSKLIGEHGKFGTAPVFFTAISTILGAIMFLRFGYAVGSVGLIGTLSIVLIGHLVTIPTSMALAEIATNQKVEGGGEYYIISRSFGLTIGASIGIALFLSQAISVAFYIIAFSEAFNPVIATLKEQTGFELPKRVIGLVSVVLLAWLMATKGAKTGMWLLYVVVAILGISLIFFFAGSGTYTGETLMTAGEQPFFYVFAIVFPAFTGMTAGVGLSGDLKDPKRSIPRGTIWATLIGLVIYLLIAFKLATSVSQADLLNDQLVMSRIAIWGPIIPIGLAAATISSALGSVMVAPRTLNAIAMDRIIPFPQMNRFLGKTKTGNGEPVNASLITCAIAFFFVLLGDVNAVAEIISMFFMVTYGSICSISLLENFASNPGYRPAFKSRWYFSLLGAVLCVYLMFKMNSFYAFVAIGVMIGIYYFLSRQQKNSSDMSSIFRGVIFQISRNLHVFLQKRQISEDEEWRPSVVAVSKHSFKRIAAYDLLRWLSHRIGFGTYIHHVEGYLSTESAERSMDCHARLVQMTRVSDSTVFVDTLINPNYGATIAQALQMPGVSGKDNNMVLFEYSKLNESELDDILENMGLVKAVGYDTCILASSPREFGFKHEIHVWITSKDYVNANLMIYIAYILMGHPDWQNGIIKLFAIYPQEEIEAQRAKLLEMIQSGRLPISANNIDIISMQDSGNPKDVIAQKSRDADLTIVGFRQEILKHDGREMFKGYDAIGNVLFVNARREKAIK